MTVYRVNIALISQHIDCTTLPPNRGTALSPCEVAASADVLLRDPAAQVCDALHLRDEMASELDASCTLHNLECQTPLHDNI